MNNVYRVLKVGFTYFYKYSERRAQRQTKTNVFKFGYAEPNLILSKYSESRAQRKHKRLFFVEYDMYRRDLLSIIMCLSRITIIIRKFATYVHIE